MRRGLPRKYAKMGFAKGWKAYKGARTKSKLSRSPKKSGGRKGGFVMGRRRKRTVRTVYRTARRSYRKTGGIKPMINKAARGLGYAAIAGLALNMIAPQFSELGKIAAAFYGGGIVGAGAQIIAGGGLGAFNLGGLFPQSGSPAALDVA